MSGDGSGGNGSERVEQDAVHHCSGPLPERDPDANLARPLRDGIRDHTVQTNDGEQESEAGERAGHRRPELLGAALPQAALPSSPRPSRRRRD